MDIKDILDSLGLDLTDPETKRGALEAINAILDSRKPPENFGGDGGGNDFGSNSTEEVEIDPDLLQPSIKHQPQENQDDADIEIEDEENILDQIKHNDSEDDFSNSGTEGTSNDSSDSDEDSAQDSSGETSAEKSSGESAEESEQAAGEDSDEEDTSETESQSASEDETEDSTKEETDDADEASKSDNETDETGSTDSSEEEADTEDAFDEEDLLDDTLKSTYEDEAIKAKHEARKIKRERTLQAAKKALEDAKAKNAATALIHELESAINALEALAEAVVKNIKDISDDEFNRLINRVFDAIDAIGDSGITYSSDEERKLRAQEIKTDISSTKTQQELSAEDIAQIRAETQAIQARDKEADKYKTRARGSFKGFQDFLNSLYRAIALQVATEEARDDSWSAINRRHSGSGVLQPGKRINDLPDRKIPVIDFYFDQSGSWTSRDISVGQKAVNQLVEMEEKGQIKINIFYFSNDVFSDAASARAQGGTRAWNEIVKNVIATQATNVIIMTDSDMEDYWRGPKPLSYTVPGYVWYLWRDGDNAPRLPRDLRGRGGTQQFSFST